MTTLTEMQSRQAALTEEIRARQQELRTLAQDISLAQQEADIARELARIRERHGADLVQRVAAMGLDASGPVNGG